MAATDAPQWILVVPVKHARIAKSRLTAFAGPARPDLARAMAADSVSAALSCRLVRAVVVVTDDRPSAESLRSLGAIVVPDEPAAGLNQALTHGAEVARHQLAWVGALSADLPALRTAELTAALSAAPLHQRSFVADAGGSGTTLLLAPAGLPLEPRFGRASADAHTASGAIQLEGGGLESLRRDVDTEADVAAAVLLGVGARTAAVLGSIDALKGERSSRPESERERRASSS